ncbi:Preprotein translocase, SecE subunit [uncultured delta proteobacterium]|uniref:Protein translocase subunit SecE n=1 Tax=uncultured delta proteobacterium TaxID=34034 RepID=A0A212JH83_9DELT|nr:Preprotein translocase, SecE subunit [uncultured delta proteobacterium]
MAAKQSNDAPSASSGNVFTTFRDYLTESRAEIKKVTWPTKKEARVTSIAVLILVAVMSVFLGLVDLGWTKIVELILS